MNFDVSSFVYQVRDGLAIEVSVSDIRLYSLKHADSCFVELDESAVVKLAKSEQLKDLTWLRSKLVNTNRFIKK